MDTWTEIHSNQTNIIKTAMDTFKLKIRKWVPAGGKEKSFKKIEGTQA